jgi:molecular chaperone GrpE
MIRENFMRALKESGLEEIPAEGLPFDPYVHECVHFVDDGLPDGYVKELVQKGYTFRKRVMRPARVVVVKHQDPEQGEQDG